MYDATSSDPLVILSWGHRQTGNLFECVVHFGTARSVKKLKRRRDLPSLDEVKAAERHAK